MTKRNTVGQATIAGEHKISAYIRAHARGGWVAGAECDGHVTEGALYRHRSSARRAARALASKIADLCR